MFNEWLEFLKYYKNQIMQNPESLEEFYKR